MQDLTRCCDTTGPESCQLVRNIWAWLRCPFVVRVITPTATTDALGRRRRRLQLEGGQNRQEGSRSMRCLARIRQAYSVGVRGSDLTASGLTAARPEQAEIGGRRVSRMRFMPPLVGPLVPFACERPGAAETLLLFFFILLLFCWGKGGKGLTDPLVWDLFFLHEVFRGPRSVSGRHCPSGPGLGEQRKSAKFLTFPLCGSRRKWEEKAGAGVVIGAGE